MYDIHPYLVQSFFFCKNQTLIAKNRLYTSQNKQLYIGKIIDSENDKVVFDSFEIDSIDHKQKIIIEYKKSCSNKEGSLFQLIYYLYLTKDIYKNYKGKLICIENKKDFLIELNQKNKEELFNIIDKINNLNHFDNSLIDEEKCLSCGYYDYCIS